MTLRVLIADDEAPARRKLSRFLAEHPDIEVVGEASNGIEAVDLIAATAPSLVFLDIQMPDLDGLGVVEILASTEHAPSIVFVTAFDRYAVKAFEVSALDYLLKPYDRERFEKTLERARRSRESPALLGRQLVDLLSRARNEERYARRLLIPNEGRSFFVATRDIVRLQADGNNVLVHVRKGTYGLRATLESFDDRLDPQHFARVHRSHMVNIDEIAEIRPWFHGDYTLLLRDGSEIPWSRRFALRRPDLFK
jgi:two-component system LytT family response regulator